MGDTCTIKAQKLRMHLAQLRGLPPRMHAANALLHAHRAAAVTVHHTQLVQPHDEHWQRSVGVSAQQRQVQFNFLPASTLLHVNGDSVQLSQIILNLYRNAMDALIESTQAEIQIHFEERNGRVLLAVRDNGSGLNAAALAHVGEAFFTTKDNGLGMGLSISRHIAEQHGGTLRLINAESGGALAILDLPSKSIS
jgi:C4-dicarboxylate-specific signal transduction histidine kinase